VCSDAAAELNAELVARLAHLESRDAYREFYATETTERPFFEEENIPDAHRMCPRVGIIRRELDRQHAETVLELGCLDGWVLLNLATAGYRGVGIDLNRPAIAEASRRAQKYGLLCEFVEGFIEDFSKPKYFDAVLLLEILEHVLDVDAVLAVAEKHLAPGGRVYISAPVTPPPHKHEREQREHVRLITEPKMRAILNGPGRTQRWYEQMRVPDGMHHFGAYSLATPASIDAPPLVVIPTVSQNWHFLKRLLRQIRERSTIPRANVFVIYDGSNPDAETWFAVTGQPLDISNTRRGLVPAVNVGFHRFLADDGYGSLMLLDDSVEVDPGWDKALQRTLKAHPEFGWVACQQYENTATPWTSFCSLMSRAAAETIREFDLLYSPMHYDDADAIMRLRKAGFEPHGIPFKIHHKHDQAATPLWRLPEHQLCAALSREAFKWRWGLPDFDWKTIPVHEPCERCRG
jgi:SAM-dependent methyltransferase